MTQKELLKKLLPGFIPLFVFIAADEIWGTKIGLFVAIATGLAEITWVGLKEKRFDSFILFDTLLLVVLGGVSIILENDIFFKLKPGLIELVLVGVLAVSAFSPVNIIGLMGQRYLKGTTFSDFQLEQMRKSLRVLFFIFMIHTALVFYSAFFMSKEAWVFISGVLFYLIFAAYLIWELIAAKIKQKKYAKEEWVPLVDEKGSITGQAPRSQVHNGSMLLHPVVHLHVFDNQKNILLQKRPLSKQIQPGKWDTAVGGHISAGETLEKALEKEASEEIGLKNFSAKLVKVYKWESEVEAELVYLFVTNSFQNLKKADEEVEEIRFWTRQQIEKEIGVGVFTPNFEHEFSLLKEAGLY
jgi:isopentenyldiphosphate isomerase/intracellular septation protein A